MKILSKGNRPESKRSFRYNRIFVENKNFCGGSMDLTDMNCYAGKRTSNHNRSNSAGNSSMGKGKMPYKQPTLSKWEVAGEAKAKPEFGIRR